MDAFIHNIVIWLDSSKYFLFFWGALAEGPVVMMTGGFLFKLGQVNFLLMYLALVLGDFVADICWYCVGRFGTRSTILKFGRIISLTPEKLAKIENRFHKYHQKILIISKMTMGLGFSTIVLVVAGITKVPFKKYAVINLLGGFIWTAFMITIGYFFGNIYNLVPESAKVIFIGVVLIVIVLGLRYANNYLERTEI